MPTPLPEVRSVLQRAQNNRMVLQQLLDTVPADRWENRADGDAWTAHIHLAHLATIDTLTMELLREPGVEGFSLDQQLQVQRTALISELADQPVPDLRAAMDESRDRLWRHVAAFDPEWLAQPVIVERPGHHPPRQSLSLRAYLASWAEHDLEHAEAIRAAITVSIQPGALSAAARVRKKRGS